MIIRNIKGQEQLDVSGLNKITVLLDRSESELAEIGFNEWTPNQLGPPHNHPEKDQVFFIYSGIGVVKLGNDRYDVARGDVVYVPSGLVHQTITTQEEPLTYVLFNVFNDVSKEGHATFADHIEKVKEIRKQQAESGSANIRDLDSKGVINNPKFIQNMVINIESDSVVTQSFELLNSEETNRFSFSVVKFPPNGNEVLKAEQNKECALFIVEGGGEITLEDENDRVGEGDLFYVPPGKTIPIKTRNENTTMLRIEINVNT